MTVDPENISQEPLKKSAFCHLGIATDPKRNLHTKNHAHTTTTEVMGRKGLKRSNTNITNIDVNTETVVY